MAALSVEFVAKPQEANRVQSTIPAALAGAFEEVHGFAGCLVMISDQEARLITVITLWAGEARQKHCRENGRWVQKLLSPFMDRCLRVQTLSAYSPGLAAMGLAMRFEERESEETFHGTQDETTCVV